MSTHLCASDLIMPFKVEVRWRNTSINRSVIKLSLGRILPPALRDTWGALQTADARPSRHVCVRKAYATRPLCVSIRQLAYAHRCIRTLQSVVCMCALIGSVCVLDEVVCVHFGTFLLKSSKPICIRVLECVSLTLQSGVMCVCVYFGWKLMMLRIVLAFVCVS